MYSSAKSTVKIVSKKTVLINPYWNGSVVVPCILKCGPPLVSVSINSQPYSNWSSPRLITVDFTLLRIATSVCISYVLALSIISVGAGTQAH